MASLLRLRPAAHNMTADQLSAFRNAYAAMMAIGDNRGYAYYAGLHGAPNFYCWHHQQNNWSAANMEIFLPWHRAFLYNFEMAMRDRVGDAVLPWWDWTLGPPRQSGIPDIFAQPQVDGAPNPLYSFAIDVKDPPINHTTTRQPGSPDKLLSSTKLDDAMGSTDWNDFCSALEDVHDNVHGWVSGDMGVVVTSAFDPIFWSHHCMIDRVWAIWQVNNGNGNISPDLLDVVLTPFPQKVSDVLSVNNLGYDYAAADVVVPGGGVS